MAEILGVVASGISVAQIAGQLLGCIEQLRTFCTSIRDIPEYLQSTLNDIETLGLIFARIETFDESTFLVEVSRFLQASLRDCQAAASALESLTTRTLLPLNRKSALHPVHLVKAVLKKEEMKELKARIDSAKSSLQLAMSCHSTYGFFLPWQKHCKLADGPNESQGDATEAICFIGAVEF